MSKKGGKRLSSGAALRASLFDNDDDEERHSEEEKAERAREKNQSPSLRKTRAPGVAVELEKIDAAGSDKGPGAAPAGVAVPKKPLNSTQLSELYTNILNMANRNVPHPVPFLALPLPFPPAAPPSHFCPNSFNFKIISMLSDFGPLSCSSLLLSPSPRPLFPVLALAVPSRLGRKSPRRTPGR